MNKKIVEIKELISNGDLMKAFDAFSVLADGIKRTDMKDALLITKSRFLQLESDRRNATIHNETYTIERNKILYVIIELLNDLDYETEKAELENQGKFSFKKVFRDRQILISFTLLLLVLLTYFVTKVYISPRYVRVIGDSLTWNGIEVTTIEIWIAGFLAILTLYKIVYNYLDIPNNEEPRKRYYDHQNINVKDIKAEDIAKNIEIFTIEQKEKLVDAIRSGITDEVIDKFREFGNEELKNKTRYDALAENFNKTERRIENEINALNKKSNVNLTIGVITTASAVIFLFYVSLNLAHTFNDWLAFISYFIPRLTLVIFIEVFSFYFLKLYRTNLNEIQYYQNELTDIDFKIVALKGALLSHDDEFLKQVLNEVIKIDHNKILKKDETTVDIEKFRAENENTKELLNKIFDFYDFKNTLNPIQNRKEDSK